MQVFLAERRYCTDFLFLYSDCLPTGIVLTVLIVFSLYPFLGWTVAPPKTEEMARHIPVYTTQPAPAAVAVGKEDGGAAGIAGRR